MRIYKRVSCPHCPKYKDIKIENDKLKKDVCVSCGKGYDITQRNSDYYIDYSYEGRRIRENVGKSKGMAEIILAKIKSEIAENRHLNVKRENEVKFNDFADEYIELYAKTNNVAWERSILPNMKALVRFFADKKLTEITPLLIEKFKVERVKEVSPAATNRALTLLKSMFNRAIEWNKFNASNPVTKVKFFREDNYKLRYLEKHEIDNLVGNCDDFLRPIIIVAVNTGMRKAELFNLKWDDIDFNKGIIHLLRTKNGEKREIPMNEAVKAAVIEAKKHPDSEYVFCTRTGKVYTDIRKPFARSLKRAGIANFRFHDLRHTFASQLAMASVDLNTIRELMGHKSLKMTLRYAHLSSNHKNVAVDLLNKCLQVAFDKQIDTQLTHDIIENEPSIANDNTTCLIAAT